MEGNVCIKKKVFLLMYELHVTAKYTQQSAACVMLTHISSLSRRIRVLAVCLMSVQLHNNI
jgi:hypothetical protein